MSESHEKYERSLESIGLSEAEIEYINSFQKTEVYKKGTMLLSEGQIATKSFHIIKGCVRKFHLKDGEEKTTDFYIDQDSIATRPSGKNPIKSKYNLECLEETTAKVVTFKQEEILYKEFPRFQAMCRISTELQLEEYQEKLSKFISSSPTERYLNLMKTRPELLGRVPQYQLASFLGIKPESLSRIRKRIME